MADPANTGYEQNLRSIGPGTVPADPMVAPAHAMSDQPMLIPLKATIEPAKPAADTSQGSGPSGTTISIPTVGKKGK